MIGRDARFVMSDALSFLGLLPMLDVEEPHRADGADGAMNGSPTVSQGLDANEPVCFVRALLFSLGGGGVSERHPFSNSIHARLAILLLLLLLLAKTVLPSISASSRAGKVPYIAVLEASMDVWYGR